MTAGDAYRTARILADNGLDSDAATTADLTKAADLAGAGHPDRSDRAAIRAALDTVGGGS